MKYIGDQLCSVIFSICTVDTNVLSMRSKRQFFHDYLHFVIMLVATYNPFRKIVLPPSYRALR